MDNWPKLVTLSIMVLACGCLESYHFAVLIFLLFAIGLVFRQMNISVPDEASSSSSSTSSSSSSSSSSISVPDASSSSSSTSLSSSSSFSFSKGSLYDVFISFRGEDTRKNFTGHLYEALTKAGINAFIDDEELKRGEDITTELWRAIQGSRISIIVFSRWYADSSWCLEELVKIMECKRTLGQLVLPIFYDVDPSHVRKQTGSFAQSFLKHTDEKKVGRWRAALTEASNLSGWDLRNTLDGNEAKFIRMITNEVSTKLNNTHLDTAPYQVGIDSRVLDISYFLGIGDSDDVRVIGISGMGGIGKTTLAKAVYNQFYDRFEGKSFLEKVREQKLEKLQKQLLSDILQTTKIKVSSVARGTALVGERFRRLKVLVIVDDVDDVKQLRELVGNCQSFGPGSRVIITTRNKHMLKEFAVDKIYSAKGMEREEALELLSWHAFRSSCCPSTYLKLAIEVVNYCGGLPLALQVLGSTLFEGSVREWKSTLDQLKMIPFGKIQEQLKVSYDRLNDGYERAIFCDIACFFIGMDKNDVIQILNGCGFYATAGIKVLLDRCLLTVNTKNKVMMHDLLRDMGRDVVRKENSKFPGERSRLWHPEDVIDVLIDKSGTEKIEGLALDLPSLDEISFSTEAFTNMKRLRLLQLNYVRLTGGYQYLSKNLKWLCWCGFPLEFIPKDLCQPNIVAIDMRYSSLRQVFCEDSGLLDKLKILNLSHSHDLTRSPDFSKLPNLEKLILKGCERLSNVHESIGDLKSLALVNLEGCEMLKGLPRTFYKLKSVKILVLNGCSRFKNLYVDLGKMSSLTTLAADGTAITEVPSSIGRLENLRSLSLRNMRLSLKLPPSLMGMNALRELDLSGCNLKEIPNNIGSLSSLVSLRLDHNDFHSLPSFSSLSRLQRLSLNGCENLVEIADDLPPNLSLLSMNDCTALEKMPNLSGSPRVVALDGSSSLIEFPGLDSALNTGMILGMRAHNRISEFPFKESTLQALNTGMILGMRAHNRISAFPFKASTLQGWTGTGYIYVSIMVLVLVFYHFAHHNSGLVFDVLIFLSCSLGLVFRQMNISVPDKSSSSSSSFSLSSPAFVSKGLLYEVFISFRGEDTRKNFTGHLHEALTKAGINAFIDDEDLSRGKGITTELEQAILGSKISIIVFSRRYADSSWCLEELVKIMECKTTLGQLVLPIFYEVDPSHVRKQTGSFAQSFLKHTDEKKVRRWRAALTEASNLPGWDLSDTLGGNEAKFIRMITNEVTTKLNNTYLDVAPYRVGIDSRVQDISNYLGVGDSDDVRMIGIWGMGGIGKTTIAKAVYNEFYDKFDGKSFLENMRGKNLVNLQSQLVSDILQTKTKVSSIAKGSALIGKIFQRLRVLVILDDVDDVRQLRELAGNRHFLGPGSRIIITTRNKLMLKEFAVDKIYPVKGMEREEAIELLSWHAFRSSCCPSKYLKLAGKVVNYCGGLPLALKVLGSTLFKGSVREWKGTLKKLKIIPHGKIQEQLKISYDGLNDEYERKIFCDIACFFIGMDKNDVMQILNGCGFYATAGIKVLLDRCLLTVNSKNKMMMHDLLQDMGREIVRAENFKFPGERSRLWRPEDVIDVLIYKSGTEKIEGLALDLQSLEEISFSTEAFINMKRLRLLQLKYVRLAGGYQYLSKKLKWLCWRGFPLKFIPKDLCQPNIVAIDMRYSSLRQVLCNDSGLLDKLKILNLSHSHDLTRSPDFSKLPNLEKLILKGCTRLSNVHESIGDLKSLALVNLEGCNMLNDLPRSFFKLKTIEILVLIGCSRLQIFSEDLGEMASLRTLRADKTAITEVTSSIVRLEKLKYFSV